MVFVYGSLHKKCLVLWKERYFVLKVSPPGTVGHELPSIRRRRHVNYFLVSVSRVTTSSLRTQRGKTALPLLS